MDQWTVYLPYLAITLAGLSSALGVGLWLQKARHNEILAERDQALSSVEAIRAERDEKSAELVRAEAKLDQLEQERQLRIQREEELTALREKLHRQEATTAEREEALAREKDQLLKMGNEIQEKFKALAAEALKASQNQFLDLADQKFAQHKTMASADLEKRQEGISNLLKPMQDTLKRYEENLKGMEQKRQEAYGTLQSELKQVIETQNAVKTETGKLVNALRAQPKTRGRWGEQQLQNVMELSGMSEHVDFQREVHVAGSGEGGPLRPDAIIRMPGNRQIVVDAKTSMSAYLDALDAVDEAERTRLLIEHASQIRKHVKQLAAKEYWRQFEESPDFVAMFVPGENFFAAAVERDPDLLEFAMQNDVLIVTPTTLMALAKAVAYGWRQERIAENAREVAELGRELYGRLATMGGHIAKMGKSLGSSVDNYNRLVGSLETKVMPQARKFQDLKIADGGKTQIEDLAPIEQEPREPLRDKDLLFEETPSIEGPSDQAAE